MKLPSNCLVVAYAMTMLVAFENVASTVGQRINGPRQPVGHDQEHDHHRGPTPPRTPEPSRAPAVPTAPSASEPDNTPTPPVVAPVRNPPRKYPHEGKPRGGERPETPVSAHPSSNKPSNVVRNLLDNSVSDAVKALNWFAEQDSSVLPRLEGFRTLLVANNVSSSESLLELTSPQAKALHWIAYQDPAKMDVTTVPVATIINRYILALLYFGTTRAGWLSSYNFLTAGDVCEWHDPAEYGVTCSDGVVDKVNLYDNFLKGTIPTELGLLSTLTNLQLSSNYFSGTVPREIGNLTNLQYLGLAGQTAKSGSGSLSGEIPTELGLLTTLTVLDLSSNQFPGTIPAELGSLANLQYLYLSGNGLSGTVPSTLSSLSKLVGLYLYSNANITGNISPIFCSPAPAFSYYVTDCSVECSCCSLCH